MNLRHIELVLKIAELGSFTKAANRLKIPQPSLSQSILNLEKELKMPLFDRSQNPVKLTAAGEIYHAKAASIMAMVEGLNAELAELSGAKMGKIRIGFSQNGYSMLPGILPAFCKKFPTADIKIIQPSSTLALKKMIVDGEVDLGLLILPIATQSIEYEVICERELFLALPATHPLASKKERRINLNDAANERFILPKSSQRSRADFDRAFRQAGFRPRILCETETFDIGVSIVASGVGACFTIADFVRPHQRDKIALFSLTNAPKNLTKTLAIAHKKDQKINELGREFIKLAKTMAG